MAGDILSVTVPATTIRSAWRGEAGNGMIPKRMKSYLGPEAAINSIAQHANPNWKSQSEYDLDQLSSQVTGLGVPKR
jgi:hypothetical protein